MVAFLLAKDNHMQVLAEVSYLLSLLVASTQHKLTPLYLLHLQINSRYHQTLNLVVRDRGGAFEYL